LDSLEKENQRLKALLETYENKKKNTWRKRLGITRKATGMLLGKGLKNSLISLFKEFNEDKNVSNDTIADIISAVFMRLTRIGTFLIITSLLPSVLILLQIYYLSNQNQLITGQNNRLDQQTYLQEAERRSGMIALLDNMIETVTKEGVKNNGVISKANSARLVAISKILKPYKYLENDLLIENPLSPERGYLLLSLLEGKLKLNSIIDTNTQESLLAQLNFSYAELQNASLTALELKDIHLTHADLKGSNFTKSTFVNSNFEFANLEKVQFFRSDLVHCNFKNAHLSHVNFSNSALSHIDFENANLENADFSSCDLEAIQLKNAKIIGATFDGAHVPIGWIASQKGILPSKSFDYLRKNYRIKIDKKQGILIKN